MLQSTLRIVAGPPVPSHVAVIMDGNGRWATYRGRPRTAGHLAGARASRRVIEAAARAGVGALTLYAFSADNWSRPPAEVRALMALFGRYLANESARCAADGVRLQVIGRRDRLDPALLATVEAAEQVTRAGRRLRVRLAIDYSARDAILAAAVDEAAAAEVTGATLLPHPADARRSRFASAVARAVHDPDPPGDVDLLVRTGGELRLSDFLLWECAYAELWFTDVLWPDFTARDFGAALADFARRQRRFGKLAAEPRPVPATGGRSCA
jgi:undecaprenyl diphosphate synthase